MSRDTLKPENHNQAPRKGLAVVSIFLVGVILWAVAGFPGLPQ